MKVPALLKNKYVFYGLAAVAVLNVAGYAMVRSYECLALFGLSAYGAHCYCKNKSLSILAALFVANFVFGCGRVKEGFEEVMKGSRDHLNDARNSADKAADMETNPEVEAMANQCSATAKAACMTKDTCEAAAVGGNWTPGKCDDSSMTDQNSCTGQWDKNNDGNMVDRVWDMGSDTVGMCA